MLSIAINIWRAALGGASDPHPSADLLLESGSLFLLETGTDTLLIE